MPTHALSVYCDLSEHGIVRSAVSNFLPPPQAGVDFLRLGPTHHIHPHLHQFTPSHTTLSTVAEVEELYHSKVSMAT